MTNPPRTIRPFAEHDLDAIHRIWLECGWVDADDKVDTLGRFLAQTSQSLVGEIDGSAECLASMEPGTMHYLDRDLDFTLVSSVTTSRIARRQGLASRLTAAAIAADAEAGAPLTLLGMFDQGFYDRLGFGTGARVFINWLDPAKLRLPAGVRARPPKRLGLDDAEAMHQTRLDRRRRHGTACFPASSVTRCEMEWTKGGFGLGYHDGPDGALSHHLWAATSGNEEDGPYRVRWMAYQTNEQLLELLAVIASWGDQILEVRMEDPPGLMLQDLLETPIRSDFQSRGGSKHRYKQWHAAWWQARMLDVPRCVERARLTTGDELSFNLELSDPIDRYLPDDVAWRGCAGSYLVSLGRASSGAERGTNPALPTLRASVNAFTRLWIGSGPALGLEATTDLEGPDALIQALDRQWCVPRPFPDWPL